MTEVQSNRTRTYPLSFWFIVLALASTLTLTRLLPAAAGQPKAVVPETVHDFGEAVQDKVFSHTFIIKNAGTAPLKILEVDPDCACTVPSYDRTIPPGQQGKITLKLKRYSVIKRFRKKTRVRLNDPDTPQVMLVLTGYAKPIIEIKPSHIIRFRGDIDEVHQAEVRFISHLSEPWKITGYKTNLEDKVEVTIKPEKPGKVYVVRVKNKETRPGHYAGKIYLMTTAKRRPRLLLRVFADLYLASAVNL
ncbi:MAG: DUF1573 domain-containing protein [Deltaproteobacteria bacterium]|nr:DUF1573 domain-containing protein [Deltaproteobacteria bacterium]